MANLKIKNAPLIPDDQLENSIKLPTGGKGNYAVSLGQISNYTKNSLSLAVQSSIDELRNTKADKTNTYTKEEVDERISLGQGGVYGFKTYNDFLSASNTIPPNSIVTILEEGQYQGDNIWDGIALTPSPYDPVAQSKEYTDSQLVDKADKNSVYLKSETFNQQEVQDLVSSSQASINNRIDIEIIQNGAALPFDETVDYAEGAFTVKDGSLQQFTGGVWKKPTQTADKIFDASGDTQQEINDNTKKIAYANFRDAREWGVIPDQTTDYTTLIRDIVQNQLDSYEVLYIPFGVRWNYSGIYSYLKDYQTIVDDSGRDEARNLWQSTRVTWHKTNANTGATNGNTETISGDYHPAYVVDTYGTSGTVAARASTVYRLGGSSKWQTGMDATTAASHFSIAQYGSFVDGTKSFTIGHQDGTVAGKFGFNHALTVSSMLYNFGKASYLDDTTPFTVQFLQSSSSTADFQQYFRYGATTAYREDIKVDGTHSIVTKNSRRITTTADCVRYGTRKNVKVPTSSILLTADESSSFITNIGSSVAFTASLPKAAIGLSFEFSVDAAFGLRVQPNAADNFVGLATGKYKESPTVGNKLKIVAVTANTWSFEQTGTWTDQA